MTADILASDASQPTAACETETETQSQSETLLPLPPPLPKLSDRVAQCRRCVKRTEYQPYLAFFYTARPAARAQYCPRCGHPCPVAEPDYADTLCLDNAGLTRKQAFEALTVVSNRNAHALSSRSYQGVENYMAQDLGLAKWPTLRSLTTPLQISCRSCGGSYVFYRNAPDIQRTPPLYCVWCASSATSVTQLGTEESAWITLAQHYGTSVEIIQAFYEVWSTHSPAKVFSDFMAQPRIQAALLKADHVTPLPAKPEPEPFIPPSYPELATADSGQRTAIYETQSPLPFYNTCSICGCEQPRLAHGKPNLAPYCEPCTIAHYRR